VTSRENIEPAPWQSLVAYGEAFTCYSSALAAWVGLDRPSWPRAVNNGLHLTLVEADDGLFGFAHFSPGLREELELRRCASDDADEASAAILEELERSGRVIVAGDGYNLPWHVAAGRRHVPHWFVLAASPAEPRVVDPFTCRNDLGRQEATQLAIEPRSLAKLALSHPADDRVVTLRERFALGDDASDVIHGRFEWLAREPVGARAPGGVSGPDATRRLARHFRDHLTDMDAYRQADDVWSIGRHRAFLAQYAARVAENSADELGAWVDGHAAPLARRWSNMAPLLLQATLALGAGRQPSTSVAETLEELADREAAAAQAFPADATQSRTTADEV
jgi:hypothetical protein